MALNKIIISPLFPFSSSSSTTTTTSSTTAPPPSLLRFPCRSHNSNSHRKPNPTRTRTRKPNPTRPKSPHNPNPNPNPNPVDPTHPAFRRIIRKSKLPINNETTTDSNPPHLKITDSGVTYLVPGSPFEYMYSYTETPKTKPLALREPPLSPFGPDSTPRPWTGKKPLEPSKKKNMREFDSFVGVDKDKKGVKPVQRPGPYLPGTGPVYVMSREMVLGEELRREEVRELVEKAIRTKRQLNMGRDGLTHNMLDNIHAHWKRRRVCRIKCKGVCTVDMDNVCQQLEEKTGGKIIFRKGGVIYLFRGRNYNYKTRPRYPLMLWRPVTPVYPRLVKRVPEGLTLEEVTEMRRKGRTLIPICKLGKNGVYLNLVRNVREAFEACELVRINCQGMNGSDFRKIGGKLKDLVPCVLISFENEHILMWRGRDWKSSLGVIGEDKVASENSDKYETEPADSSLVLILNGKEAESLSMPEDLMQETYEDDSFSVGSMPDTYTAVVQDQHSSTPSAKEVANYEPELKVTTPRLDLGTEKNEASFSEGDFVPGLYNSGVQLERSDHGTETISCTSNIVVQSDTRHMEMINSVNSVVDNVGSDESTTTPTSASTASFLDSAESSKHSREISVIDQGSLELQHVSEVSAGRTPPESTLPCENGLLLLLREAVSSGSAVILDDSHLDADSVFERSAAFAQIAPPGPVFVRRHRKVVENSVNVETDELEVKVIEPEPEMKRKGGKIYRASRVKYFKRDQLKVAPSLGVDELAKLLA